MFAHCHWRPLGGAGSICTTDRNMLSESMQTTSEPLASAPASPLAPLVPLLLTLIGYAVILRPLDLFHDGDAYWHVAAGQWMLDHRAVPLADPFSYSVQGKEWIAHEWLSELLMALVWRIDGWNAVVILYAAALGLTLGLLGHHLQRWLNPIGALLLGILAAVCIGPAIAARPHILVLPVLELWTAGLLIARAQHRAPSPWLLLLMPLWANLHGSFIFGVALACPLALEAVMAAGPAWRPVLLRWAGFIIATAALTLLNPHGLRGVLFPFQLSQMTQLKMISEWRPPDFSGLPPIEPMLLLLLYVGFSRGVRLPLLRLLIALGLIHLALGHARHQILVGIVGTLLLAEPFAAALNATAAPAKPGAARHRWALLGLPLLALMTAIRLWQPVDITEAAAAPSAALAAVPPELRQSRMFNEYAFGGYLIYQGLPAFIDGRTDLYGDDFVASYFRAVRPDRAEFLKLAEQYHFSWTILQVSDPAIDMLDALPGWHRLYADQIAVIHTRAP